MNATLIEIDGSQGEGGGQIVRSSCALSALTGQAFKIFNVRAGRKKPGLKRQHVTAVKAAAQICSAEVSGAEIGSHQIEFFPGELVAGEFHFRINSAGSSTLVAQTVLPALMLGSQPSQLYFSGGTHNMMAPPFDYLQQVYLPLVMRMGPQFKTNLKSYGFYPVGGGEFVINVQPVEQLSDLEICQRGELSFEVTSIVSKLPLDIAARECKKIERTAKWKNAKFQSIAVDNSPGPGNVVMIKMISEQLNEIVTGFGQRGVKAEHVALGAYREAKQYIDTQVPVGPHLADQLLLPMGLAASQGQSSRFLTSALTDHSKTHIEILKRFLEVNISVSELEQDKWLVEVSPP